MSRQCSGRLFSPYLRSSASLKFSANFFLMSRYHAHSVVVASEIKDICTNAFSSIGKMDKACRKLSKLLDRQVKELATNTSVTVEELNETELLRKTLDTLAASKVQLAVKSYDLIDHRIKLVDNEISLVENALVSSGQLNFADDLTSANAITVGSSSSKKRKHNSSVVPTESQVDPNEPVYCFCKRIAFGDMIACDNEDCDIEWFHYPCVNLTRKPRNSWICPTCAYKRKK